MSILFACLYPEPLCFSTASKLGDNRAKLALGECYATGKGVRRDLDKAAEWFLKSTDPDAPRSMEKLSKERLEAAKTRLWLAGDTEGGQRDTSSLRHDNAYETASFLADEGGAGGELAMCSPSGLQFSDRDANSAAWVTQLGGLLWSVFLSLLVVWLCGCVKGGKRRRHVRINSEFQGS